MRDTRRQRKMLVTFVVAGAAAVIASDILGPTLKKKARVR